MYISVYYKGHIAKPDRIYCSAHTKYLLLLNPPYMKTQFLYKVYFFVNYIPHSLLKPNYVFTTTLSFYTHFVYHCNLPIFYYSISCNAAFLTPSHSVHCITSAYHPSLYFSQSHTPSIIPFPFLSSL